MFVSREKNTVPVLHMLRIVTGARGCHKICGIATRFVRGPYLESYAKRARPDGGPAGFPPDLRNCPYLESYPEVLASDEGFWENLPENKKPPEFPGVSGWGHFLRLYPAAFRMGSL